MRGLLFPGERSFHTAKEHPRRRRQVLHTIAGFDRVTAVVVRYRRPAGVERIDGRRLLIQAATGLVVASGVNLWVLDDQDPHQRDRDRAAITRTLAGIDPVLRPSFDHRPSRDDPLLWVADAVCWAVGAGNEWRHHNRDHADRPHHRPLTRNTRLLTVPRARRVHFPRYCSRPPHDTRHVTGSPSAFLLQPPASRHPL